MLTCPQYALYAKGKGSYLSLYLPHRRLFEPLTLFYLGTLKVTGLGGDVFM